MSSVQGSWRGPNIVKDGLVLYLDAGSPNSYFSPIGGTIWKDISGNGYTGSLINGVVFTRDSGSAMVFDGVDDEVRISYHPTTGSTISIWVKPSSTNNMDIYGDEFNFAGCGLQIVGGKYAVITSGYPLQYDRWSLNASPTISKFDNVVTVFNSSSVETYVNSTPDIGRNQQLYPGIYMAFSIGDSSNGGYDMANFSGTVASLLAYNRALSAQEVLQNYNATKARFGL